MSTARKQVGNRQKLANYIQSPSGREQLNKYAPKGVTEGEVKRIALWAVEEGADDLDECTPGSIVAGVLQSLHEGLDITTDDAYLVPYGNKAKYMRGYQGLVKLAERPDDVRKVDASLVHEHDEYRRWRDDEGMHLEHEFSDFNRGEELGVYAVIHGTDGQLKKVEVLDQNDLRSIRQKADDKSFAWKDFPGEMKKKSAVRRACKWVDTPPVIPDTTLDQKASRQLKGQPDNVEKLPSSGDGNQSVIEANAQPTPDQAEPTEGEPAEPEPEDDAPKAEDLQSLRRSTSQLLRNAAISSGEADAFKGALKGAGVWDDRDALERHRDELAAADDRASKVRSVIDTNGDEPQDGGEPPALWKRVTAAGPKHEALVDKIAEEVDSVEETDAVLRFAAETHLGCAPEDIPTLEASEVGSFIREHMNGARPTHEYCTRALDEIPF